MGPDREQPSARPWLVAGALVPAVLGIAIPIAISTGNPLAGLAGGVALCGLIYLLVRFLRARVESQLAAIQTTGRFEIDAGLDFTCLPENWPTMARETLNPAGAASTPMLPVRLAVDGGSLRIDKKQSWGSGRTPFHAEVPLADITQVTVGKPQLVYAGSSFTLLLRTGGSLRAHLQLPRARAEVVADHLRQRLPGRGFAAQQTARGIVVNAEPPPLRASPARAGGLLMLAFLPFPIAMLGAPDGPFAAVSTLLLLFYALWLQMRRPPTMHRRLAVGLASTSVAFVIDTASSGEAWRLIGAATCLVVAWHVSRMSPA